MNVFVPTPVIPDALSGQGDDGIRLLRRQTKNALAALLLHVSEHLEAHGQGQLAHDVERRILLLARISDALFGMTVAPGPFPERLRALCNGLADLLGRSPSVALEVEVRGTVSPAIEAVLLQSVHELAGDAIRDAAARRVGGPIRVSVQSGERGTSLVVASEGWADNPAGSAGAVALVQELAQPYGGEATLCRRGSLVLAILRLP